MTPPTASEAAVAIARAAQDDSIAARSLLKMYLADGTDPIMMALAACRMLAKADTRICEAHGRPEGSWLSSVAMKAARQRSEN